jgi:hypothetical protein
VVGFLVGLFWFILFVPTIGGVPGSRGLTIVAWIAALSCPVLLLGHFFGFVVFLLAPFGNAVTYGLAALICHKIRDRHSPRFLSITRSDSGKSSGTGD